MATTAGNELAEIATLRGEMNTGFAALNGKIDTLIAQNETAQANRAEDRAIGDQRHKDHEARLRVLEERRTISPMQLWTVVLGALGVAIPIAAILVNALK